MTPYSKIFKKLFPVRRAFEDIPPPKDGRAANTMMNERYHAEKGPLMNKGKADESSSTLLEDLDRYSSEVYYKRDLKAGLGILKEVAGAVSVGGFLLSLLTVWMPAVGITVSASTIAQIMFRGAHAYNQAAANERKQIRAAVSWIKGGCSLGARLIDG